MADSNLYVPGRNLSLSGKNVHARSLIKSAVSFVFEKKFDSAAGCFEALLILIDAAPDKLNCTEEQVLTFKFALCCCYFYGGADHERNLQLLSEIQKFEEQIPAICYINAAVLYRLDVPSLALKNVDYGLGLLARCTLTKLMFWPETEVFIELTEKIHLKRSLEELKAQLQSAISYMSPNQSETVPSFEKAVLVSPKRSALNVEASEFFPGNGIIPSELSEKLEKLNSLLKDEFNKQQRLLQRINAEQLHAKDLTAKLDSQQKIYDKKLKDLEDKLEAKEKVIASLSDKDRLTDETKETLLLSIKSLIVTQNNAEIETAKSEIIKLKNIIAQLTEKYFSLQLSVNKSNEKHCVAALDNLHTLLKNHAAGADLNLNEVHEEINMWQSKMDNVKKHRRAAENALISVKDDMSEDGLKLLCNISESCSCVIEKPDLLQQLYLKKISDNKDGTTSTNLHASHDEKNSTAKDWKYLLRKHRVSNLGLNSPNGLNAEMAPTDTNEKSKEEDLGQKNKRMSSFVLSPQETWMEQEISKLSDRVKLIGGPNYWKLIVQIKDQFPMESEENIVDAVEMVRASHGKLNGLSKEIIFNETRIFLQEKKESERSFGSHIQNKFERIRCSICSDNCDYISSAALTCGHEFHKSCIREWLWKEPVCPFCRSFVAPEDYNTINSTR